MTTVKENKDQQPTHRVENLDDLIEELIAPDISPDFRYELLNPLSYGSAPRNANSPAQERRKFFEHYGNEVSELMTRGDELLRRNPKEALESYQQAYAILTSLREAIEQGRELGPDYRSQAKTWEPLFEEVKLENGTSIVALSNGEQLLAERENLEMDLIHSGVGFIEGRHCVVIKNEHGSIAFLIVDTSDRELADKRPKEYDFQSAEGINVRVVEFLGKGQSIPQSTEIVGWRRIMSMGENGDLSLQTSS